jgi:hypothetical protein
VQVQSTTAAVSIPALAAALSAWQMGAPVAPVDPALHVRTLAPMYRLPAGSPATEAHVAAQLTSEVAERLRRLRRAYGEWRAFEPGPYFDLTPAQVDLLTRVHERVATVHVVVFLDALLPAFQAIQSYAARFPALAGSAEQSDTVYATLAGHWERMLEVVHAARQHLHHDIGFLALNGAAEEHERWRTTLRSAAAGGAAWATQTHRPFPSLTLSLEFPLPAYRQPGRKRRLRRTWQRLYGFPGAIDGNHS